MSESNVPDAEAVPGRLDRALVAHERAETEVDRLIHLVEEAVGSLSKARQKKKEAQRELDAAAEQAKRASMSSLQQLNEQDFYTGDDDDDEEDDEDEDYPDEQPEQHSEGDYDSEDEDGFDLGDAALEQIRYRLETAKIDPNSPEGTRLLDDLLARLQETDVPAVDEHVVNEHFDDLLFAPDPEAEDLIRRPSQEAAPASPPPAAEPDPPRVRIHRGGRILGWYRGGLDAKGYAREGEGSMYYDAGHECHGTWRDDQLSGRGVYRWADGHRYDGDWAHGQRHGLGRFVRPDRVVLFGRYERGHQKGEGVRWSADRREAQIVVDGVPARKVPLGRAVELAAGLGFDEALPPPV